MTDATHRSPVLPVAGAAMVGAVLAFQSVINGDLSEAGAGMILSGWVAYIGALVSLIVVVVVTGRAGHTVSAIRTKGNWAWFAFGLAGVPLVLGMAGGVPLVGAAIASVCSIAGQTLGGLAFDTKGIGRDHPLPLTAPRAMAGLVALVGLVIAVTGGVGGGSGSAGADDGGTTLWVTVGIGVALLIGGIIMCIQQAGTGFVTGLVGDPVTPALTAVTGGTVGVTLFLLLSSAWGGLSGLSLPGVHQWWLYLGGPLGAIATVISAWAVRRLGVFMMTLSLVGGQMLTSILIDAVRQGAISWPTVIAALVICGAVVLAMPRKAA
ncbi:MAG: DMT family transporter [Cellulomonadaceae bacterium]|jgi:transporter family-2 protein|nr:DMT family transporter [Cellulomonadaceae bacterium]